MAKTTIEWTASVNAKGEVVPGYSYNPWRGCVKVSPGCQNCYAETFAKRTGHNIWGPAATTQRRTFGEKHWQEPLKWNEDALQAGERRRVFCSSMADVFEDHPQLIDERLRLWKLIDQTPQLDWLLLTKRPENIDYMAPCSWVAAGVDAKTAAASIYRDFQQGLRPDLIDKGLVKERVKAMIIGDNNMAALATEIAQELATEMGIPLQQALAAAGGAMGVATGAAGEAAAAANAGGSDMTAGGAQAGTTFVAGFLATADGTQLVAGIVGKLQTEMPKFLEAGKGAGTQWGAGFMTTVESGIANPLINLLVTLVTPGIMAQMAAGKSQTEPPQ